MTNDSDSRYNLYREGITIYIYITTIDQITK